MTDHAEIRRGSAADLPSLEPLWVSVHHRHVESMPELAPYVDDRQTGFRPTWTCLSRFAGRGHAS